jgi:hypothetical protein
LYEYRKRPARRGAQFDPRSAIRTDKYDIDIFNMLYSQALDVWTPLFPQS